MVKGVIKSVNISEVSRIAFGGAVGFVFFWVTSHSKSPVNKRLPAKRYRSLHYLPNIKVERNEKHYHIHHWVIFIISYMPVFILRKKIKSKVLHGFFIGTIVQGLTYDDRFTFIKSVE